MLSLDIIKQHFKTGVLNGSVSDPAHHRLFAQQERARCGAPCGPAASVSHLDSVAAYSSGSSETRALLPRQHKQLRQPLLH